ncbi:MAG TPA: TetR/AcrR family transcriptional regulator [Acidimicrobiales bacterium]|nr:TetR/AcrR family transcriptional regulator [Acidimicrobiales bacterium]
MASSKTSTPRRYESPVRRRQAVETRERIIEAGCTLLRRSGIRDWRALTIRGVALQAGVNERTVYRYFGNERGLRDAVMHRLEEKAGIELEGMRLEDVTCFAARIFDHVSAYPGRPKPPLDPTLSDAGVRQKAALLAALAERTSEWTDSDRTSAAALLDVLWNVASYERLVSEWELDHEQAIETVSWAIKLVTEAISDGRRPGA